MELIKNRFRPAFGVENPHLQTLYPAFFSKPKLPQTTKEIFELSDGDFVELVWHKKPSHDNGTSIVVLFHGLAGNFNSPYIKRAMNTLGKNGFSVVLMHFRGCGNDENRLARSYHSGDTCDAKSLIQSLKTTYPKSKLHSIGYSLGGNMLLKLLGESGKNSLLTSAIAISVPMQLESSANSMNSGFSKLYQYRLMATLKKQLLQKYLSHDIYELIALKKDKVKDLKSFWEFDDAYTAPIHGFSSACEYYEKSSSKQFLKDIQTKTLIIHSSDDPFMSKEVIPRSDELSNSINFELYSHGGHVGFVSGSILNPKYWLEERIVEYFKSTSI